MGGCRPVSGLAAAARRPDAEPAGDLARGGRPGSGPAADGTGRAGLQPHGRAGTGGAVAAARAGGRGAGAGRRLPCDRRAALSLIAPPTEPQRAGQPCSQPGTWRVTLTGDSPCACRLDIQRDDALPGFRGGVRQWRLIDLSGAAADPAGRPLRDDPPGATVLTCGTVNRYAGGAQQLRVGAATACPPAVSAYSSRLRMGRRATCWRWPTAAPPCRGSSRRGCAARSASSCRAPAWPRRR